MALFFQIYVYFTQLIKFVARIRYDKSIVNVFFRQYFQKGVHFPVKIGFLLGKGTNKVS